MVKEFKCQLKTWIFKPTKPIPPFGPPDPRKYLNFLAKLLD